MLKYYGFKRNVYFTRISGQPILFCEGYIFKPDLDKSRGLLNRVTMNWYISGESGIQNASQLSSGLWIADPEDNPFAKSLGLVKERINDTWLDEMTAIWMISSDYLNESLLDSKVAFNPSDHQAFLLSMYSRDDLIYALAVLNNATFQAGGTDFILNYVKQFLNPKVYSTILGLVNGKGENRRVFLTRATILRTMRIVAENSPSSEKAADSVSSERHRKYLRLDLILCAVLLVHVVGEQMKAPRTSSDSTTVAKDFGIAPDLILELICSGALVRTENVGNLIGRTRLLYVEYAPRVSRFTLKLPILEFIREAIGMPFDDYLSIGFALWAFTESKKDLQAPLISIDSGVFQKISSGSINRFLDLYSQSIDEFSGKCRNSIGSWQMHPIQDRPLLREGQQVLVLDQQYLLDCFTRGLYWRIHDHARDVYGDDERKKWTQFYAEMHEAMVGSYFRSFALEYVGERTTFFGEEKLKLAFPEGADVNQYLKDLNKMVLGKVTQLDSTANNLLLSEQPKASPLKAAAKRIYPIVITGGIFTSNPYSNKFIDKEITSAGLLTDPRVEPLSILDLRDLEEAEGIKVRDGVTLLQLIVSWKSTSPDISLSDWIRTEDKRKGQTQIRSGALREALGQTLDQIVNSLAT